MKFLNHDKTGVLEQIVENLNNVLNSKAGYSYFNSGFGVSDYSHYNSRDHIAQAVIAEVHDNINEFEPRLQCTSVDYEKDADASRLSFIINCIIKNDARSLKLVLDPKDKRYFVSLP